MRMSSDVQHKREAHSAARTHQRYVPASRSMRDRESISEAPAAVPQGQDPQEGRHKGEPIHEKESLTGRQQALRLRRSAPDVLAMRGTGSPSVWPSLRASRKRTA